MRGQAGWRPASPSSGEADGPRRRGALEVALETAPGATSAHLELGGVLLELEDSPGALAHAERALALEGDSPRVLGLLARALAAAGREDEARAVMSRALAAHPDDEALRVLAARLREGPRRAGVATPPARHVGALDARGKPEPESEGGACVARRRACPESSLPFCPSSTAHALLVVGFGGAYTVPEKVIASLSERQRGASTTAGPRSRRLGHRAVERELEGLRRVRVGLGVSHAVKTYVRSTFVVP